MLSDTTNTPAMRPPPWLALPPFGTTVSTDTPITDSLLVARGFKKTFVGDFTNHPEHREYYLELREYEQDDRDSLGIEVRQTNGSDIRYWWISFYRASSGGGRKVSLKALLYMEQVEAFIAWFTEDNR